MARRKRPPRHHPIRVATADDVPIFMDALTYLPETGQFAWSRPASNRPDRAGKIAGSTDKKGYILIKIQIGGYQVTIFAHRLVWAIERGWPTSILDHIDGVKSHNAISNLREADPVTNAHNRKTPITNTSGYIGVIVRSFGYVARITANRKHHHLGVFRTAEEAYAAYLDAKARLHPFAPKGYNLPEIRTK